MISGPTLQDIGQKTKANIEASYTMALGIYGSKPTEPEGKVVYVAINP